MSEECAKDEIAKPITPHIVLALDLELESNRIIQIGAVIGDLLTGEILSEFTAYVNPNIPISDYITTLTGITNKDIEEKGTQLKEAYDKLIDFWNKPRPERYEPKERFYQIVVWGGGDAEWLHNQVLEATNQVGRVEGWPFGRRTIDVKTLHQFARIARGEKPQSGLSKSMNRWGLHFKGTKHQACDDARNTFLLASFLMKEVIKK